MGGLLDVEPPDSESDTDVRLEPAGLQIVVLTLPGGLHVGRAPPEVLLIDVDRPLIGRPSHPGFPISEVVSFAVAILAPLAMVPDCGLVSLKACRSFLLTVGITFSLAAEAARALLAPNWLFFFPDSGE